MGHIWEMNYKFALLSLLLFPLTPPAFAEQLGWQHHSNFRKWMRTDGKVIPTDIDCRVHNRKLEVKLTYDPVGSRPRPFHKWNFLIALETKLDAEIAKLRRSDRLELKYRAVYQDRVIWKDNNAYVCAVAFR